MPPDALLAPLTPPSALRVPTVQPPRRELDPADPYAVPTGRARAVGWAVAPVVAWSLAVATLWWNPVDAGGYSVVLEAFLWVAAIAASIAAAAVAVRMPVAAVVAVGVVATLAAVYGANWSGLECRTYFALHRPAFAQVGALVRDGKLGAEPAGQLPMPLRPLSAGEARVVGRDGDRPLVFLPQQSAGSSGYVYFDGDPHARLVAEVGGERVRLVDGLYLGGGWWWL